MAELHLLEVVVPSTEYILGSFPPGNQTSLILAAPSKIRKATLRRILGKYLTAKMEINQADLSYRRRKKAKDRLAHARYFRKRVAELLEVSRSVSMPL